MRAVRVAAAGDVAVREVPVPQPAAGEMLVEVIATAICATDRKAAARDHDPARTLGHEVTGRLPDGTIAGIHPEVSCGRCPACRAGWQNRCPYREALGLDRDGGLADLVAVPPAQLIPLGGLDPLTATMLEPLACAVHAVAVTGLADPPPAGLADPPPAGRGDPLPAGPGVSPPAGHEASPPAGHGVPPATVTDLPPVSPAATAGVPPAVAAPVRHADTPAGSGNPPVVAGAGDPVAGPAVVVGAGAMGILCAWVLQAAGVPVAICQRSPARRRLARELGIDTVFGPADDPARRLGAAPAGIIVTAPGPAPLEWALVHAAPGGVVHAFAGTPGGAPVDANLVHYRHLRLVGSTGSRRGDYRRARDLVAGGEIKLDRLPHRVVDLAGAPAALRGEPAGSALKTIVAVR